MKYIMKKIAMMGMLSCMASSNIYTQSYEPERPNLISLPVTEESVQKVNIKVYNLPENTFIAAGIAHYAYDGKNKLFNANSKC